ncbi:DUF2651 family protein [Pseudogracilibacillus auburnensis]|uniref:DUF2651 family protein n=1 Tax=Pseudogracilibacillus auburnensis TaxID=1494959 RepID=UPI001A96AF96|nr:DUF2651 family protein [Pseudogracilibacillus auburnensis]MBO1003961.1 DUF2651 family protein [Pseudogracilibacillus auburnensis]
MWEIPFYGIVIPIITIVFSLISTMKYRKYFIAPVVIFIGLNIMTIVLPLIHNVGWEALFGWAVFYAVISLIISLIVWLAKRKTSTPRTT